MIRPLSVKKTVAILSLCAVAALLNCGYNMASGVETGNPDVSACASTMANEAFLALHTENNWQPSSHLNNAAAADSMQNVTLVFSPPATGLGKKASTLSDTSFFSDSTLIIYDTLVFYDTVIKKDTLFVRDTVPVSDTISTTRPASGDTTTVDVAWKKGSIVICDTVVITDTLVQKHAKAVIRIIRKTNGEKLLYAVAETLWIRGASNSIVTSDIPQQRAPMQWELSNVDYKAAPAFAVSYQFVSAAPIIDTVSVPAKAGSCVINARRLFLSQSTIAGGIVLSRISYSEADSTLGIIRFFPAPADTAESLSVVYKVDVGANVSSGSDDRLLGIFRGVTFRPVSKYKRLNLHISPDLQSMTSGGPASGSASITLTNKNGVCTVFYGIVDKTHGLLGTITEAGEKYQVSVGTDGKTNVERIEQ
jgi:hypothetical protein